MIVELFIPQSDSRHPLRQQFQRGELDELRITIISERPDERLENAEPLIDFPQQQPARVRSDRSPIKRRHNFASPMPLKQQPLTVTLTLRFHKTASCAETKSSVQNDLRTERRFCVKHSVRNPV